MNVVLSPSAQRRKARLDSLAVIEFPADLPVVQKRADLARAISDNQVVIVCGETGSGKTTQLPKICLTLGRGVLGCIGHTQPRRVAARTVATRIAFELKTELGGGVIPVLSWYAPPLNGDTASGLGAWESSHLTTLLASGVAPHRAVAGPMSEVVGSSLQYLNQQDIGAMALYLKSLPQQMQPPVEELETVMPDRQQEIMLAGAKLYENHCAACHQADGKGVEGIYPALAGSASVRMAGGMNAIHLVLSGGFAPSTAGNPRPYGMPPFGQALNDAEVASVLSYVRNSWGNTGNLVSQVEVNKYRSRLGD